MQTWIPKIGDGHIEKEMNGEEVDVASNKIATWDTVARLYIGNGTLKVVVVGGGSWKRCEISSTWVGWQFAALECQIWLLDGIWGGRGHSDSINPYHCECWQYPKYWVRQLAICSRDWLSSWLYALVSYPCFNTWRLTPRKTSKHWHKFAKRRYTFTYRSANIWIFLKKNSSYLTCLK